MNKWYGIVGFAKTRETSPGIWKEEFVERQYYGDVIRNVRKLQSADKINDDLDISNDISIICDPYAMENFHSIRYVEFMRIKWKVNSVEVTFPRLKLTLGGVYNG